MPTNGKKKDSLLFACHIRCNKRFNKFQFSEALFSTGNSNNAFCKLEKQGKRALTGITIELKVQRC